MDQTNDASGTEVPVLNPVAFRHRMEQEIARVRRSGGFLSLALVGEAPPTDAGLARLAERLRARVRLQDVLGWHGSAVALLMPGTPMPQAARAAERLLASVKVADEAPGSVGLATAYGEVEGGAEALLAAAKEALGEAAPGQVGRSRSLAGRPRILVVDDDRAFAQILAETISERGWEGHPCSDMADVLQRCGASSYSGLFVDLVMPKLNGAEVARHWTAAHPGRPVVLMSGYDSHRDAVMDALSLGPVMFVKKPLSGADLDTALAAFRQLLPGARPRPDTPRP